MDSLSELAFVPAAVGPPEGASAVALARFEFTLVHVALLAGPSIDSPALFLVEPELSDVVISGGEVEFPPAFQLPIVELPVDYFMRVFEEADPLPMRPVYFGLPHINDLRVFEKFRSVEGRLGSQHGRRAVLYN